MLVLWVKTAAGKAMPLDGRPADDGNIVLEDGVAHYLKKGEAPPAGTLRWRSHFATCPQAAAHRRPARPA